MLGERETAGRATARDPRTDVDEQKTCGLPSHFGTIRKSVDISEPCSDELEMLLPFELEGLAEEADPDRNPPPRITRGESAVVESGMASRAATSIVVESTVGDVAVGVCDTVRAFVGGAERDSTLVSEFELLLATLSGRAGIFPSTLKGACSELPVELGEREFESLRYCRKCVDRIPSLLLPLLAMALNSVLHSSSPVAPEGITALTGAPAVSIDVGIESPEASSTERQQRNCTQKALAAPVSRTSSS